MLRISTGSLTSFFIVSSWAVQSLSLGTEDVPPAGEGLAGRRIKRRAVQRTTRTHNLETQLTQLKPHN